MIDASPLPPTPISADSITITEYRLSGSSLFLDLSWEAPEITYGEIEQYQVRIASSEFLLLEDDEQEMNQTVTITPFTITLMVSVCMFIN